MLKADLLAQAPILAPSPISPSLQLAATASFLRSRRSLPKVSIPSGFLSTPPPTTCTYWITIHPPPSPPRPIRFHPVRPIPTQAADSRSAPELFPAETLRPSRSTRPQGASHWW